MRSKLWTLLCHLIITKWLKSFWQSLIQCLKNAVFYFYQVTNFKRFCTIINSFIVVGNTNRESINSFNFFSLNRYKPSFFHCIPLLLPYLSIYTQKAACSVFSLWGTKIKVNQLMFLAYYVSTSWHELTKYDEFDVYACVLWYLCLVMEKGRT